MPKRIEKLTPEQEATFRSWVDRWTAIGLRTGPLSEDEWRQVEAATRRSYKYANLPEPRVVLGVASPLAAAVAACVAAEVAPAAARHFVLGVWSGVQPGVSGVVGASIRSGVESGVQSGVRLGVQLGIDSGVWSGVRLGVEWGVGSGVEWGVRSRVRSGIRLGVRSGIDLGVGLGVRLGVRSGVEWGVRSRVRSGIDLGVGLGVRSGIDLGVGLGVRLGVRSGVEDDALAPFQDWLHPPILRGLELAKTSWYQQYRGGNLWCSWNAWVSWFRDVGELELPGDLWNRLETDNTLCLAGPSWWYGRFCVISDRPTVLRVENVGGVNRLHCEDGPAIAWADGWGIYSWHGTQVPAEVIEEDDWSVERIMRLDNTEVRRALLDRIGWDRLEGQLGTPVATALDPGNPGRVLALYDLPEQFFEQPVRVVLMTNGSPDRSGSIRRYGETVPAVITDPIAAQAWAFDVDPSIYAALERAT